MEEGGLILLSYIELADYSAVTLDIFVFQITEKVSSVADHFEQTSSGMMVEFVGFKMLGEFVDAIGKYRDLNFGRACVGFVSFVLSDYFLFLFFGHFFITFQLIIPLLQAGGG